MNDCGWLCALGLGVLLYLVWHDDHEMQEADERFREWERLHLPEPEAAAEMDPEEQTLYRLIYGEPGNNRTG